MNCIQPSAGRTSHRHHKGVGFVPNPLSFSIKLDGNQRARILHKCEVMERRTKLKGKRNGMLGIPAMIVLRCLLTRFHNKKTGLCCPSYDALQEATGLCRQSISNALASLVRAGVLTITRRLVRVVNDVGAIVVRSGSNLYAMSEPPQQIDLGSTRKPAQIDPGSIRKPPKTRVVPRVYEVDCNHQNGFTNIINSPLGEAFSPEAIHKRRAQAGLR